MAAWFGGSREKHPDVGIWLARFDGHSWSEPVEVADGDGVACWNPVLFQTRRGPLMLFYKVGADIAGWRTHLIVSNDGGRQWSGPRDLGGGLPGPVKNNPLELDDGTLLCPTSDEPTRREWQVYFSLSVDRGQSWEIVGPCNDPRIFQAIQPTLFRHRHGVQALCRTRGGVIAETWSTDDGRTWSPMRATSLPNPDSGIDGATLDDGRLLIVYNDTTKGRSPLNVAISHDGKVWTPLVELEADDGGEYSYPAVIQARDGTVHVTYTNRRRTIIWARLRPD